MHTNICSLCHGFVVALYYVNPRDINVIRDRCERWLGSAKGGKFIHTRLRCPLTFSGGYFLQNEWLFLAGVVHARVGRSS